MEKRVGGTVEQTVWSGWRPVELYRDGQLAERRVHGTGLDEVVALEQDTDGDGVLDTTRVPWYDSTGNLVVLTRPDGSVLERYDYTPFGENESRVDLNPPAIERLVAGPTRLELLLSEEVSLDEVEKALDSGDLEVTEDATGDPVTIDLDGFDAGLGLFSVAGASTTGSGATGTTAVTAAETVSAASRGNPLRRLLPFTVTNPPAAGTAVTLTVASSALQDGFLNPLSAPYSVSFAWPSAETVVDDSVPPQVEGVHLVNGHLEVTFSEDPDAATVTGALDVGDPAVSWTASADGYTYRSDQSFGPGSHSLTVDTSLLDRAGLPLPGDFDLTFDLTAGDLKLVLHERPDLTLVSQSTVGNRLGFHGLELDPETGLYYARHRYYDPELGRFLNSDPLGYVDGPNSYQYALNNPVNFSDPMGLEVGDWWDPRTYIDKVISYFQESGPGIPVYVGSDVEYAREFEQDLQDAGYRPTHSLNANALHEFAVGYGRLGADTAFRNHSIVQMNAGFALRAGTTYVALENLLATGQINDGEYFIREDFEGDLGGLMLLNFLDPDTEADLEQAAPGVAFCYQESNWVNLLLLTAEGGRVPRGSQSTGAANRALHEQYLDSLRAAMGRPSVRDAGLSRILDDLYRPGARIGSGSTAAAVRHEAATGTRVGGRLHAQKAQENVIRLQKWLERNPTATPGDRAAAENVLRDLRNAQAGN